MPGNELRTNVLSHPAGTVYSATMRMSVCGRSMLGYVPCSTAYIEKRRRLQDAEIAAGRLHVEPVRTDDV